MRPGLALLALAAAACADPDLLPAPSLSFSNSNLQKRFDVEVESVDVADGEATIVFVDERSSESLVFDLIDDAIPVLPAPGDVLAVVGSVTEFEELPEPTYFRFHLASGPFFVEGGFARRDGDDPMTGEDIDGVFRFGEVVDPWTGAANGVVMLDDGPVTLTRGGFVPGTLGGVDVRAVLTSAKRVQTCQQPFGPCLNTDTLSGYVYVVAPEP